LGHLQFKNKVSTKAGKSFENRGRKVKKIGGRIQRELAVYLFFLFFFSYDLLGYFFFYSFYQALGTLKPNN